MTAKIKNIIDKSPAGNGRFGVMAAVVRRQFCAEMNVCTPQEV